MLNRDCVTAFLVGSWMLAGCGGGGATQAFQTPPPHKLAITLAETPGTLQIDTNQTESFTATITNDPANKGVTWKVICLSGIAACGSLAKTSTASGEADTYTAPTDPFGECQVACSIKVQVIAASASVPAISASANLGVNSRPMLVNQPPTVFATVGQYLNFDLNGYAQGGAPPFALSIKSGTLPSGLTLNPFKPDGSDPSLSGIPNAVSASNITFTYADSGNPAISVNYAVPITINPMQPFGALTSSRALPSGTIGAPYGPHCFFGRCSDRLDIGGGMMPYAWSWTAAPGSATPPGLALDATCAAGIGLCNSASIKGTPTAAGAYNFVVTVTDSESPPKQSSANYSITVNPTASPSPSASP